MFVWPRGNPESSLAYYHTSSVHFKVLIGMEVNDLPFCVETNLSCESTWPEWLFGKRLKIYESFKRKPVSCVRARGAARRIFFPQTLVNSQRDKHPTYYETNSYSSIVTCCTWETHQRNLKILFIYKQFISKSTQNFKNNTIHLNFQTLLL